jgi:hypothetical protein
MHHQSACLFQRRWYCTSSCAQATNSQSHKQQSATQQPAMHTTLAQTLRQKFIFLNKLCCNDTR